MNLQNAEASTRGAEQAVLGARAALAGDPTIATDSIPRSCRRWPSWQRPSSTSSTRRWSAPSDGVISQTDRLQVGEYVDTSSPVLTLVATGRSWIEANFKETELTHMHAGQPASITIDTYPGTRLPGLGRKRRRRAPARNSRCCRRRTPPATG